MFCDFTAGLEVVSFLNLVKDVDDPPRRPRDPNITEGTLVDSNTAPPGRRVTDPSGFESVHSGTFHDRFPGDTRIQLDLSALVSFYDPALAPSLIEKRRGLERWDHRLEGIHNDDLEAVRKRLSDVLTLRQGRSQGSGIDWQSLVRVIIKRYEKRLELLQYILQSDSTTLANEKDRMIKAHVQLNIMLVPYILTSAVAPNSTDGAKPVNSSWASPIFRHCATAHTAYIASLESSLTRSELLLLSSVQETTREICRALVTMWSDGVLAGVNHDNWNPVPDTINGITEKWRSDVNALMGWLDWSTWVRCKPACGFEVGGICRFCLRS
jgi:hypothetical protein